MSGTTTSMHAHGLRAAGEPCEPHGWPADCYAHCLDVMLASPNICERFGSEQNSCLSLGSALPIVLLLMEQPPHFLLLMSSEHRYEQLNSKILM
jgi:hypothetical protein